MFSTQWCASCLSGEGKYAPCQATPQTKFMQSNVKAGGGVLMLTYICLYNTNHEQHYQRYQTSIIGEDTHSTSGAGANRFQAGVFLSTVQVLRWTAPSLKRARRRKHGRSLTSLSFTGMILVCEPNQNSWHSVCRRFYRHQAWKGKDPRFRRGIERN